MSDETPAHVLTSTHKKYTFVTKYIWQLVICKYDTLKYNTSFAHHRSAHGTRLCQSSCTSNEHSWPGVHNHMYPQMYDAGGYITRLFLNVSTSYKIVPLSNHKYVEGISQGNKSVKIAVYTQKPVSNIIYGKLFLKRTQHQLSNDLGRYIQCAWYSYLVSNWQLKTVFILFNCYETNLGQAKSMYSI